MTDRSGTPERPPYDAELARALPGLRGLAPPTITAEMIPALRVPSNHALVQEMLERLGAKSEDVVLAGYGGDEIAASVITRERRSGVGPGFVHLHSGGMILGTRFDGIEQFVAWAVRYDGVLVTVDYRLAPEFPDPYPVEDSYAALQWTAAHASQLRIDPESLFVVGASAGGGLAAGAALLARARSGPALAGQLLSYPMLDDRARTPSNAQFEGVGVWDRLSNITGWTALLGTRYGTDDVSESAAPARTEDHRGLPPAYLEVGSAEIFRDECVAYASALWAAGVDAELHVWPGAFHACDLLAPTAIVSRRMATARDAWIARMLG